jgi:hypothetical protein
VTRRVSGPAGGGTSCLNTGVVVLGDAEQLLEIVVAGPRAELADECADDVAQVMANQRRVESLLRFAGY